MTRPRSPIVTNPPVQRIPALKLWLAVVFSYLTPFLVWSNPQHSSSIAREELRRITGPRSRLFRGEHAVTRVIVVVTALVIFIPVGLITLRVKGTLGIPSVTLDSLIRAITLFLSVPLALVGLVIPFLTLSINLVFARLGLGAIAIAFRRRFTNTLIFNSLGLLGLGILITTALYIVVPQLSPQHTESFEHVWAPIILGSVGVWTIILISFAAHVIWRIVRSFSPKHALEVLQDTMLRESMRSLRIEIERNLSVAIVRRNFKEGDPVAVPVLRPEYGQLIVSRRTGDVASVSLTGLRLIDRLIRWLGISQVRVHVVQPFTAIDAHDQQVGSLIGVIDPRASSLLSRVVRASLNVKRRSGREDRLLELFETHKEAVANFVRGDNDVLIQFGLDGYRALIREYLALGIRLNAETYPNLLSDWRPILLMTMHLRDIVEIATSLPRSPAVGPVAYWLRETMEECLEQNDEYVFSRLLDLYRTMFFWSLRSNNTVGLDRSHSEPLSILDYRILRFGATEQVRLDVIRYHLKLAHLIISHVTSLLAVAIKEGHEEQVTTTLRLLTPTELLAHFRPELPFEKWDVQHQLRNSELTTDERKVLEEQYKIADDVEQLKSKHPERHSATMHAAAVFLIDKRAHEGGSTDTQERIFRMLWDATGDWRTTVAWLDGRVLFDKELDRLWDYWPESRAGGTKDPLRGALTIAVLKTLVAQKALDTPLDIAASRTVSSVLDRIENLIDEVVGSSKWHFIIGTVEGSKPGLLRKALRESRRRYEEQWAKSIREATLDATLVKRFEEHLLAGFGEEASLRRLLNTTPPGVTGTKDDQMELVINGLPKEALVPQDRVHYGDYGKGIGEGLGEQLNAEIFGHLSDRVVEHSIVRVTGSIDDALTAAVDSFDPVPLIILLPGNIDAQVDLWSSNNFESALIGPQAVGKHHYGTFKGHPVYHVFRAKESRILVLKPSHVCYQEVSAPVATIREYTREELSAIAATQGAGEDKVREGVRLDFLTKYSLLFDEGLNVVAVEIPEKTPTA